MFNPLAWWARYLTWTIQPPNDPEKDRGSTTENVIWIAALAALALVVVGLFRSEILDAAKSVTFK